MRLLLPTTLVLTCAATCAIAGDAPDPAAYRAAVMTDPSLATERGESFCWHAAYSAGDFLEAYEAFGDVRWVEEAQAYDDWFIGKLGKDPDGYEGWIGPTITATPQIQEDALVGDAILCGHLVAFAETVLGDPALKQRFGAAAQRYVDLATRIVWEKWNRRGCWHQDRAGWGSWSTHGRSIDAATGAWTERPDTVLTQPLNKCWDAGIVLLRLWRITGKPEYRERVERVFGRGKMLLRHIPADDRVVWSYWTPHQPFDIDGRAPKHWVGVHSSRPGYQTAEVGMMVEVYDSGLVFDRADLERVIRTNHWMATGDPAKPWRSADGSSDAGDLWPALARFDDGIRAAYQERLAKGGDARARIAAAHFADVTAKHLGWDRLRVPKGATPTVAHPPLQPGTAIALALPIPDSIETANGDRARLVTRTVVGGTLTIELLDAGGKRVLGTLATIEVPKEGEYDAPRWDGSDPQTGKKLSGEFRVRWTLGGESRSEAIWVQPGSKHGASGPGALAPGTTLAVDLESPLDPRWHVEGAAPSAEQAHGGKQALKLIQGQSAVLRFGGDDDLPVRISFWIHDAGAKLPGKTATGPAWGVKTADGDVFALRTCWRSYLDGDAGYAWFNTGENQWFSPHPADVARADGWSEWVFDFSDRSSPKITGGGKPIALPPARFLPHGAVALFFAGGDDGTGALHVDDIRVEHPAAK